uniref:Kinesin-like protein vab-8 n=1 Tax=Ascaris suum TaxID=6253 RepID=F1KU69_ASCSU
MGGRSPLLRVEVHSDREVHRLRSVRASSHFRAPVTTIRVDCLPPSASSSSQRPGMPHANNAHQLAKSLASSPQRSPRVSRIGRSQGALQTTPLETVIPLPPSLQRFITAPSNRTTPSTQLKTVLRLTHEDLEHVTVHGNSLLLRSLQSATKSLAKYNFDHIFSPDATQQQVCAVCLPDLLQSYFNGSDACLLYFGATSKVKAELLYSLPSSLCGNGEISTSASQCAVGYPGLFPSALLLTFRLISEFRQTRPDFRHSVRISALYYSQRRNQLTDLLASALDESESTVTISEDSALGVRIENHREVRVDTVQQAIQYVSQVIRVRTSEEESEQRCGHLFFYINLYRYKTDSSQIIGGRSRLCLVDLGPGERSSKGDMQALTMPVITNLLVALFQGQRHLPSRQSALCMLLKDSLGNVRSKASLLFASLSDRTSETENIVQMMSKIQRAARPRKSSRVGSDCSSSESVRRRVVVDSEGNSSSEQSCAETVIFLGPSVKGEPVKVPLKEKSKNEIDNEKRKMIMDWMERTTSDRTRSMKVSVHVQCNEEEIDYEMLQIYPCHRPLDDIIEDEEEALTSCQPSMDVSVEQFLESFTCGERLANDPIEHPLSILSLDKTSASTSAKSSSENEVEDDDLERAMAASVSSIRSHEILSRLNEDLPSETNSLSDGSSGVMDIYRRASQLELYADERLRQMIENSEKKRKKKLTLNCCQNSMLSSGSSTGFAQASTPPPKANAEAANGHRLIDVATTSSIPACINSPPSGVKSSITLPSISGAVTRQIAQQITKFNAKTFSSRTDVLAKSKLPRRTEGSFSSKTSAEWPHSPPEMEQSPVHTARIIRRETPEGKKETKKGKRVTERRNSNESETKAQSIPSPYSKVTEAKHDSGAYSSGHGSDENGSVYSRPHVTLLSPRANRPRNRESLSASSGYESASGDNKSYAALSKKRPIEPKKNRQVEERVTLMEKRINAMIAHQKRLRDELYEAKHLLGVNDESFISASNSALQGSTLLEALTQETKILEKRLIACRNHTMLVTCLL